MTPTLFPPARLDVVSDLEDRCDSCGAAAKLTMALSTGSGLAFCGHHANRHADDILRTATSVALVHGFHWSGRIGTDS